MKKQLWLKSDPSVTAVVQASYGPDTCALIHNPHATGDMPSEYLGFIKVEDWSDAEVVPMPHCVLEKLYTAVVGEKDPLSVTYVTYTDELDLRVAIATREDILGWFETPTPASMYPVG